MIPTPTAWMMTIALAAQAPAVQNATVETRSATSIAAVMSAIGTSDTPVWLGWRVPMIDGERDRCATWVTSDIFARGTLLESTSDGRPPAFAPPPHEIQLEAGTTLVVLARVVNGAVERLRSVTGDCPIDGGGRRLVWLEGLDTGASATFLEALARRTPEADESANRLAMAALDALALHRGTPADAALQRLTADPRRELREAVTLRLGRFRGSAGFAHLTSLLGTAQDAASRRVIARAIGHTRQGGTLATLLALARDDGDAGVRGEAIFAAARLAPVDALQAVRTIIDNDASDAVRRRGFEGLARRPGGSVDLLIDMARSGSPRVRVEAVRALGRSSAPEAKAYLAEILRR